MGGFHFSGNYHIITTLSLQFPCHFPWLLRVTLHTDNFISQPYKIYSKYLSLKMNADISAHCPHSWPVYLPSSNMETHTVWAFVAVWGMLGSVSGREGQLACFRKSCSNVRGCFLPWSQHIPQTINQARVTKHVAKLPVCQILTAARREQSSSAFQIKERLSKAVLQT